MLAINGQNLPQRPEPDLARAAITSDALKGASLFQEIWPDGRQVLILKKAIGNPYSSFPELTVRQLYLVVTQSLSNWTSRELT